MDFEGEILFEVLYDHNEEWKFDSESLVGISGTGDKVSGDISSHDFENGALNVGVSYAFYMTVADTLVPNLEGLRSLNLLMYL